MNVKNVSQVSFCLMGSTGLSLGIATSTCSLAALAIFLYFSFSWSDKFFQSLLAWATAFRVTLQKAAKACTWPPAFFFNDDAAADPSSTPLSRLDIPSFSEVLMDTNPLLWSTPAPADWRRCSKKLSLDFWTYSDLSDSGSSFQTLLASRTFIFFNLQKMAKGLWALSTTPARVAIASLLTLFPIFLRTAFSCLGWFLSGCFPRTRKCGFDMRRARSLLWKQCHFFRATRVL